MTHINLVFVKVALSPLLKISMCKMTANMQSKEHKVLLIQELQTTAGSIPL